MWRQTTRNVAWDGPPSKNQDRIKVDKWCLLTISKPLATIYESNHLKICCIIQQHFMVHEHEESRPICYYHPPPQKKKRNPFPWILLRGKKKKFLVKKLHPGDGSSQQQLGHLNCLFFPFHLCFRIFFVHLTHVPCLRLECSPPTYASPLDKFFYSIDIPTIGVGHVWKEIPPRS